MLRVLTLSTLFPDATRPNFGVFVERQTLGLAARGDVTLSVVAPVGLPPFPLSRLQPYAALARLPRRERWKGLDVHRPRFLTIPRTQGRFHVGALVRSLRPVLDRLHREPGFDVIDASFFFPDGPAAVALGRRYGVPVSIKARGADIHHWGTQSPTAGQVLASARAADGLLAVGDAMKADMIALGMPGEHILVHHTGVDQRRFQPLADIASAKTGFGASGPLVVSVGALIARKGHATVIDAVASLPGVTLLIAGQGPDHATLAARIAASGAADRIRLLGGVAHADIPALVAAADVMALASASEGLANAWVEALACGTPIVIADAGSAREVVTAPEAGQVVARTAESFAAAIDALLSGPPDRAAVRALAARFTWEANAAALYAHLENLVAQAASG